MQHLAMSELCPRNDMLSSTVLGTSTTFLAPLRGFGRGINCHVVVLQENPERYAAFWGLPE